MGEGQPKKNQEIKGDQVGWISMVRLVRRKRVMQAKAKQPRESQKPAQVGPSLALILAWAGPLSSTSATVAMPWLIPAGVAYRTCANMVGQCRHNRALDIHRIRQGVLTLHHRASTGELLLEQLPGEKARARPWLGVIEHGANGGVQSPLNHICQRCFETVTLLSKSHFYNCARYCNSTPNKSVAVVCLHLAPPC